MVVVDRSRRRRMIFIAVGVVLIALLVAFFMFRGGEETPATGVAGSGKGGASAPTVTVAVPGRQSVNRTISATGTLAARREMPVGVAGEGGQVVRVLVEPGQWVNAGQVLAVIDRSVQTQTTAQLAAQVSVARADARLAQQELQRAQALVSRGFVSKADVERRTATRDAANARVRVAEAALAESRARTGRLDIRAPAAGLVLTRDVEPGQVVSSGSGVLFRDAGAIENLRKIDTLIVDKTGTLTEGRPAFHSVEAAPGFSALRLHSPVTLLPDPNDVGAQPGTPRDHFDCLVGISHKY